MFGFKRRDYKENLLRSIFIIFLISLVLGISINKISIAFKLRKINDEDILVSLTIDKPPFLVWASFMCGQYLTGMTAQAIKRGNSGTEDIVTNLPDSYIVQSSTKSIASGDWTDDTGTWPCFKFDPRKQLHFNAGDIDQVVLLGWSNNNQNISDQNGLLYGIFDQDRNMSTIDPFVGPIPSINTFTFTRYQRIDINNVLYSYFFVNKQSTSEKVFNVQGLVAEFKYSPDTYSVITYTERRKYTPYDLFSSIGGLAAYVIPVWIIMFGRGKYRSWGLAQRYLLRSSPDAKKDDDSHEKPNDIESQINNNTLVGTSSTANFSPPPGIDDKSYRPSSTYYFSTSGIPTRTNFTSLSPDSSSSGLLQSKDLIKTIDALINQKLWLVEQTLSRHYLSGFRLRKYEIDLNKLGLDVDEALNPPTAHHSWNNFNSDTRAPSKNIQDSSSSPPPPPSKPISYYGSQYFQNNNSRNSLNSLNPEEQRPQYPNVAIGQAPFEKKQRERNGDGNYQRISTSGVGNNTAASGVAASIYDGNYFSNVSASTSPLSSYYSPNIPPIRTSRSSTNSNPISPSPLHMSISSNSQEIRGSLQED